MSRQAIADARSLLEAAWNEPGGTAHRVLIHKALTALCDAVESLDRDEGPRLPLDPKAWEVEALASWGEAPDASGEWIIVEPIGVMQADANLPACPVFLWARKRKGPEGGQP